MSDDEFLIRFECRLNERLPIWWGLQDERRKEVLREIICEVLAINREVISRELLEIEQFVLTH
jgi:hypothetical protein